MEKKRIIIVGAGYGGLMAAIRLGKKAGHCANILLINAGANFVERIRNHQIAARQTLKQTPIPTLLRGTGVRFIQARVTGIQPDKNQVRIEDRNGITNLAYDELVYAPGSTADKSSVPGIRENAFTLDRASSEEFARTTAKLQEREGRVAVIGGGLTGIEAATELAESLPGLKVELLTRGAFATAYSERGRAHLENHMGELNIRIRAHTRVASLEAGFARTINGERLEYDAMLWAGGFEAPVLARDAGIATDEKNRMLLDGFGRSLSHPNIYGVGDAAIFALHTGIRVREACATAMPMGAHAANNILAEMKGRELRPFSLGYAFLCISLGRKDGLIQMVNKDDSMKNIIIKGRAAARFKEFICKYAFNSLRVARSLGGFYGWPAGPNRANAKAKDVHRRGEAKVGG